MKPNIKRIQKLSTHLREGKLGHDKFDLATFHEELDNNPCHTRGCAIGEFPVIWPHMFRWSTYGVVFHNFSSGLTFEPGMRHIALEFSLGGRWLGLNAVCMVKLFASRNLAGAVVIPDDLDPALQTHLQNILLILPWHAGGATRHEVAESLDVFCHAWAKAGLPVTDTEEEDKLCA